MPIYEYQCEKCGEVFEATQKISDAPLKKHDACGSKKVKKLISTTSFQLKGAGWYVTDYKKPKTDAKTADKPESGSDSKPATKTEAPEKKEEKKPGKAKSEKAA